MRELQDPLLGLPHTPFLRRSMCWWPLVFVDVCIIGERGLRHLFIFSAVMHELPEKRLKVRASLVAGITAKDQARASGMAVTRRQMGLF